MITSRRPHYSFAPMVSFLDGSVRWTKSLPSSYWREFLPFPVRQRSACSVTKETSYLYVHTSIYSYCWAQYSCDYYVSWPKYVRIFNFMWKHQRAVTSTCACLISATEWQTRICAFFALNAWRERIMRRPCHQSTYFIFQTTYRISVWFISAKIAGRI
jgi:hypothetical protein